MIIDGVKIDYGIIDQTIVKEIEKGTAVVTATSNSPFSKPENTMDSDFENAKIAYLEKDYFLLDGSFIFPEKGKDYNVGWESDAIANETTGDIDESVTYTFTDTHVSYGLQLYFNEDSIPQDFTITYYNNDTIVGTTEVKDNNVSVLINYDANLDWNKIVVRFTKVNAGQRARFNELVFGINEHYDEDVLMAVSAYRRTDIVGDYDECGEFSFTLFNTHLDLENIKGLSMGLMEWLRTTIWVKYHGETEYKLWGEYFSESADISDKGKIATITGYDVLYRLNESVYNKGIVHPEGQSLAKWAKDVADDAEVEIIVDPEFDDIKSTGYITEVPHREALRLIAEAGTGVLTVEPTGEIHLKKLAIDDKGEMTDDEIVEDSLTVENPEKTLGVNVTQFTYMLPKGKSYDSDEDFMKADKTGLGYLEEIGLTHELQHFDIVYSEYPAWLGKLNIGGQMLNTPQVFVDTANSNARVVNIQRYSDHITFDVFQMQSEADSTDPNDPANEGEVIYTYDPDKTETNTTWVTITGIPYTVVMTNIERGSQVKNVKEISGNTLITEGLGEQVADYQYEHVARKYDYRFEAVTDKDVELCDRLEVQNSKIIVDGVGFELSYDQHEVNIEGKDEEWQTQTSQQKS